MNAITLRDNPVSKKKSGEKDDPKRFGTLIRVSNHFADALRNAASFERLSHADYADAYLLPVVEKRYKEAVLKEARRMEGKG